MPYNPGITYDNSGLANGLLLAGGGIARGLEMFTEQQQRKQDEAKRNAQIAAGLRKIVPLLQTPDGGSFLSKEEAAAMSGPELAQAMHGYSMLLESERAKQSTAESGQRMAMGQAQLAKFLQDQEGEQVFRKAFSFAEAPPALREMLSTQMPLADPMASPQLPAGIMGAAPEQPRKLNTDALLRLGIASGALKPADVVKSVAQAEKANAMQPLDYAPRETNVGGLRVLYNPKSGNFRLLDEEAKPEKDIISAKKLDAKVRRLASLSSGIYNPLTSTADRESWTKEMEKLQKEIDEFQMPVRAQGKSGKAATTDAEKLLAEANAAIKAGADPEKVKARLKERGLQVD